VSEGDDKTRITSSWLKYYLEYCYGFTKETKFKVPMLVMENARTSAGRAYVSGLNYADGTVSGNLNKGVSIRLAQSNIELLRDVQLLYHANGIMTKIYKRRDAHIKKFGELSYECKSQYELITIDGAWKLYADVFDFIGHPNKEAKLNSLNVDVKRTYNKVTYAKIVSYESLGTDTVYCVTEPDTHSLIVQTASVRNCGEIAMSTGVCNLMSLNLVKYILKYDENTYAFDYDTFAKAVAIAVRFSDNINDISRAPLDEYKDSMSSKRRIGLGVLGLGSLHYILGIRFGSDDSVKLIENIMRTKAESEIFASAELGKEKGSFKLFNKKAYFNSYWWKNLPVSDEFKKKIEKIGHMRNSHRSANAPTGNMSIYSGVVSGGIEPVFMKEYVRWSIVPEQDRAKLKKKGLQFPDVHKGEWFENDVFKATKRGTDDVLKGTFDGVEYEIDKNRGLVKASLVTDYGWDFAKTNFSEEQINEMEKAGVFATTEDLTVDDHINTLKVIAAYTDMNSSKTVNLPEDYSYEQFKELYTDAWKYGIKGITTYRAGTMTAVLEKKQETAEAQKELEDIFADVGDDVLLEDVTLPNEYYSKGYVVKDNNKKKWYVNIAFSDHSYTKPFALFVNTNCKESNEVADDTIHAMMKLAKNKGIKKRLIDDQLEKYTAQTNVTKIARSIGFLLRHNVKIIDIVDILDEGNYPLSSFTFHIKRLLKQFIKDGTQVSGKNGKCPQCGGKMIFQEGCILCKDCSWSKCG
jgi:ribonucleoside-diphosphate reductase alpha chain